MLIGKDGKVKSVEVIKGKEIFHDLAFTVVKEYVFTPVLRNDRHVPVWMIVPIWF